MAEWDAEFNGDGAEDRDLDVEVQELEPAAATKLSKGDRIEIYWTEMEEWYTATFTVSHRKSSSPPNNQVRNAAAPGPDRPRPTRLRLARAPPDFSR
eukprot:4858872-Prymnesium_polylepis.1